MVNSKRVTFTGKRTGPRVTVRALIDTLDHAMNWLRTLDPDSPVDWEVVRIKMGTRISMTFSNPNANGAISNNMAELNALGLKRKKRNSAAPRIPEALIETTQELGKVLDDGFESLNISSPGAKSVKITPDLVQRVGQLSKPQQAYRYEWTTIEGVMDQVTAERDKSVAKFRISHPLTKNEIACAFDQSVVDLEEVKRGLPHRVAVYGKAKLNKAGQIVSIEASRLRLLPDKPAFISVASLPKTNITGGMESSDYVERVRGGD